MVRASDSGEGSDMKFPFFLVYELELCYANRKCGFF